MLLAVLAIVYFRDEAQKRRLTAADADNKRNNAEGRVHAHLIAARQEVAAGMTQLQQHIVQMNQGVSGMEQAINGRVDELEYTPRPQLAEATTEIKREPAGFKRPYTAGRTRRLITKHL